MIAPAKNPGRLPLDMPRGVFIRALEWIAYFVRRGTQHELNLAGIGSSELHPDLVEMVRLAREAVGPDVKIIWATNGVAYAKRPELAAELAPYQPVIYVSLHRPEVGALADKILRSAGIKGGKTLDGAGDMANTWAGQVSVPWAKDYKMPCQWINESKAFVLSDGRVSRCCLDATGEGVIGHVNDPIGTLVTSPWKLCRSCYQTIDGWDGKLPSEPATLEPRRSS